MNLFQKKHDWILGGFEYLHVDNVEADAGAGGATFATDDIGGVHYPRSKVVWGADGAATDTSAANPMPVVQTGTLTLPTGASTAAKQPALGTAGTASADVISVQGIASMTAVQIADNGGSITVDAASLPLPSGAATEAKQPAFGTAGTASADVLTIQGRASMTAVQIADNGGSLTVDGTVGVSGTVTIAGAVTNAGTFATQVDGAALTALQLIDNVVVVEDVAHGSGDSGIMALAVRRDADTTLADTTGDYAPLQVNAAGALKVVLPTALPAGTNNIGDVDVLTLPALAAGTNNIGDVDVLTVPADPFGVNADSASATGSISAKLRFIAATGIPITALPASTNTIEVVGDIAHDTAIGGNPVRIGARAVSADYTAVTTGDTADIISDLNGKQIVLPYSIPENMEYGCTAAITGTSVTECLAAAASGIRHYVTQITVTNSHATVGTLVEIRDGTSTVIYRGYAAALGGGFTASFPIPLRGTAATAVNAYNITTGSNTYVSVSGYKAP